MIKKVVWGLVVVGLVGILVAGAVVRTAAKTGEGAEAPGRGSGQGQGTGEAQVDEWSTLTGRVVSADTDALVVQTATGEQVVVEHRPWSFAQELGFAAAAGDELTLTGFYEEGSLEVGKIANSRTGQQVQLREGSGRPLWAGRGRRNG